ACGDGPCAERAARRSTRVPAPRRRRACAAATSPHPARRERTAAPAPAPPSAPHTPPPTEPREVLDRARVPASPGTHRRTAARKGVGGGGSHPRCSGGGAPCSRDLRR